MTECYDFVLLIEIGMLAFTARMLSKNSKSFMSENAEFKASEGQSK